MGLLSDPEEVACQKEGREAQQKARNEGDGGEVLSGGGRVWRSEVECELIKERDS